MTRSFLIEVTFENDEAPNEIEGDVKAWCEIKRCQNASINETRLIDLKLIDPNKKEVS